MSTDNNVDEQLKYEVENYKLQCFKICKEMADQNIGQIQKAYDELYNKIDSGIKSNISRSIGTKDLYNYDAIPEYKIYSYKNNQTGKFDTKICIKALRNGTNEELIKEISLSEYFTSNNTPPIDFTCKCNTQKEYYGKPHSCTYNDITYTGTRECGGCIQTKAIRGFSQFVKGEKIVMISEFKKNLMDCNQTRKEGDEILYNLITNYGRYISFTLKFYYPYNKYALITNANYGILEHGYKEYNFWIPTDYIRLINLLNLQQVGQNVLEFIKNQMYDRKLVPLYAQDVVKENDKLKQQFEEYKKNIKKLQQDRIQLENEKNKFNDKSLQDQKDFENEKHKFYNDEKPFIDIIKDTVKSNKNGTVINCHIYM